jgi:hypothetical protein
MTAQLLDPDLAYASWAQHAASCGRCAASGLDPEHLCPRGQQLLDAWLASEPAASTAPGPRSRSFGDQMRINPEAAPA